MLNKEGDIYSKWMPSHADITSTCCWLDNKYYEVEYDGFIFGRNSHKEKCFGLSILAIKIYYHKTFEFSVWDDFFFHLDKTKLFSNW